MKVEGIDANELGSWFINKNQIIREEVENNNYKRMLTLMAYSQIEHMRRFNKKIYDNRLRRDGIIISVSNFIPDGSFVFSGITGDVLESLEYVNEKYGQLSNQEIDRVHQDLLHMFNDPGELKEDLGF